MAQIPPWASTCPASGTQCGTKRQSLLALVPRGGEGGFLHVGHQTDFLTGGWATLAVSNPSDPAHFFPLTPARPQLSDASSEITPTTQADFSARPDNDVVVQGQAKDDTRLLYILCYGNVTVGRLWITRRVVVNQDQSRGVEVERAPDYLARIDRRVINGADTKALIRNQSVLPVEIENMEAFDFATHRQRVMQTSA